MKKIIISFIVIILIIIGLTYLYNSFSASNKVQNNGLVASTTPSTDEQNSQSTTTPMQTNGGATVIGQSVQNRDIVAYHYGQGAKEILFVGDIHGGYEENTALVAYQLMDYLKANPDAIPSGEKVTVIPVLNPDGLYKVVGTTSPFVQNDASISQATLVSGRFNANNVDLNRNFDCDWQASGVWQSKTVSGGTSAFSEPESQAIKNYVDANKPAAVVVWYSAAGGVYASSCHNGVSAETSALTSAYANASGYPAFQSFDFYATTGDMVNWLAKDGVPAISVLLTSHTGTEWAKNQAGVAAVLKLYANN